MDDTTTLDTKTPAAAANSTAQQGTPQPLPAPNGDGGVGVNDKNLASLYAAKAEAIILHTEQQPRAQAEQLAALKNEYLQARMRGM